VVPKTEIKQIKNQNIYNMNRPNKTMINVSRAIHRQIKTRAITKDCFLEEATEEVFATGLGSGKGFANRNYNLDTQAALTMIVIPLEFNDFINATASKSGLPKRYVAELILNDGLEIMRKEMELAY
jgi:hypothetical protein